jgi:hypothetical protein
MRGILSNSSISSHIHVSHQLIHSAFLFNTMFCFPITASTICLDHIIIRIQITHQIIIHHAFFFAESSVAVTKLIILATIAKNNIQITKYRATFMKGNIIVLYKFSAKFIQLGQLASVVPPNSSVMIPSFQTRDDAKNFADTMIIIHIIPKTTNLIHSFRFSSLSDVIILYPPKNAIAIHTTMKMSII